MASLGEFKNNEIKGSQYSENVWYILYGIVSFKYKITLLQVDNLCVKLDFSILEFRNVLNDLKMHSSMINGQYEKKKKINDGHFKNCCY